MQPARLRWRGPSKAQYTCLPIPRANCPLASVPPCRRGQFYPGTGAVDEVGAGPGTGFTVNVPWDGGNLTNGDYLGAFNHVLVPIAYEFNPDLIIVSAGFDAAEGDPIGGCRVTPECFGHLTALLKAVAPLVLILEGGYNLASTAASTEACLRVLLGEQPPHLPGPRHPTHVGLRGIQDALMVQARYWRSLRPAALTLQRQHEAAAAAAAAAQAQQEREAMRPSGGAAVAAGPQQARSAAALGVPPVLAEAEARAAQRQRQQQEGVGRRRQQKGAGQAKRAHEVLAAIRKKALRAVWRRHQRRVAAAARRQLHQQQLRDTARV